MARRDQQYRNGEGRYDGGDLALQTRGIQRIVERSAGPSPPGGRDVRMLAQLRQCWAAVPTQRTCRRGRC